MSKHLWNRPVTVATKQLDHYVTINDTEEALEFLLREWPKDKCDRMHAAAKKILIRASRSKGAVDEACDAFLAAALAQAYW
ncbi:DUF982 domain-containing protein (plasmid) [Rhizobium sp. CB3090]|uniref:DUF982 domain-containing protein n=1 Tax=Rhizobium sp. CB3090 TaxID=3039156 RepID=UPI0024B0A7F9|nr:DUF982 domain-containing protein [Rhizobium sp. CB3090]WFU11691.1 DUF982 domain-containing protein [Rhizobium sp. CB3090]